MKIAVGTTGLAAAGTIWLLSAHAQEKRTQGGSGITTNWLGCVVVGKEDSIDAIGIGGPYPQCAQQFQLGLRSDGVVVWRLSKPK